MSPGAVVKWGIDGLESSFPEWLSPTAVDLHSTALVSSSHYAFLQSKPSKGPRKKLQYFMIYLRDSHHHLRCVFLVPLVLSELVQEGSHQVWAPEWWDPGAIFKASHHGQYCYPNSQVRQRLRELGLESWRPSKEPEDWMQCCLAPRFMFISTCNKTWFHGIFWCMY